MSVDVGLTPGEEVGPVGRTRTFAIFQFDIAARYHIKVGLLFTFEKWLLL
jgi:hypothetical protein